MNPPQYSPTGQPVMPAPRPARKWPWLLLIPVGVGVLVVGGLLLLIGIGFLMEATAREMPPSAQERSALVDAPHLAKWMEDFQPDPSRATVVKRVYLNRSFEIEYVYAPPNDLPYISCTIHVETKVSDALIYYNTFLEVLTTDDEDVQMRNDLFRWGDASKLALYVDEGIAWGFVFHARQGRKIFTLLLYGYDFDDTQELAEFLAEPLANLRQMPLP